MVVVTGRWRGGGKVAIFMWLFLLWLGFGFVHGGERETKEEGRKRKLKRRFFFFWLCILVDNIYYFNE